MLRAAAVIPAAGRAKRFGSDENKIWQLLDGESILTRTLRAFNSHPAIEAIVVAAGESELERVRETARPFPKVTAVVAGGDTRTDSVRKGLAALPDHINLVLVHDAARPLVSAALIERILTGIARTGAAVPGYPLSDTIKRVNSDGLVLETVARTANINSETISGLTAVQTPQGARLEWLLEAYARWNPEAEITDEASLLEAAGFPVRVVPGDPMNIKITRPEDMELAHRLLAAGTDLSTMPSKQRIETEVKSTESSLPRTPAAPAETRTGFGYDVHAFSDPAAGRRLFLGGVEIPHDCGLEGHSDADVLLHSICDALLGAVSMGDIGILFPNTDPAFHNIASIHLLEEVSSRLDIAGWKVVNIDSMVVAEAPKLLPYREEMQQKIADCLGIGPDRVSVKATTSEKMGFVGRREGIASWAVATLTRQEGSEQ